MIVAVLSRGFHQFEVVESFYLERTLFLNTQVVLVRRIANMCSTIYGKSVQALQFHQLAEDCDAGANRLLAYRFLGFAIRAGADSGYHLSQ